jgi:hypothetical protein
LNKPTNIVSEQVNDQNELSTPNSKAPFVEPTVSTPEDVLEATTFFQAPTVDTTSV